MLKKSWGSCRRQRARDGCPDHSRCAAQLAVVPFLMVVIEVGAAPQVPGSSSTAATAHNVLKSGSNRLSAGQVRQFWHVLVETATSGRFHCNSLGTKQRQPLRTESSRFVRGCPTPHAAAPEQPDAVIMYISVVHQQSSLASTCTFAAVYYHNKGGNPANKKIQVEDLHFWIWIYISSHTQAPIHLVPLLAVGSAARLRRPVRGRPEAV